MAGNVDAQWDVGELESGCWWIWPLFFMFFFFIFLIVIILMLPRRERREPPCDPDEKGTGGRTSRGLWSLLTAA